MAPITNLNMMTKLLSGRLREDQHRGITNLGKYITIPAHYSKVLLITVFNHLLTGRFKLNTSTILSRRSEVDIKINIPVD